MHIALFIISLLVGVSSLISSLPILMLGAQAGNIDLLMSPAFSAAASVLLIIGGFLMWKKKDSAIKFLLASVILFVLAAVSDDLIVLSLGVRLAGIIWSVIILIFSWRDKKKRQNLNSGENSNGNN